ncbi:MAG: hypothetical protein V2I37_03155 [Marinilabiliaceae bacterium]|jgi:hypothetical protein|nr:hypothetical protein [Marinilabiliaceae bacterium]
MKRKESLFTGIILIYILAFTSCEKYDTDIEGDVDIYLLSQYQTEYIGSAILNEGLVLSEEPAISYSEILKYNSHDFTFKLKQSAIDRIEDKFGSAFAVTVDGEVIYTGYFWAAFSSATVDWIVIDLVLGLEDDEITVQLGYPWLFDEWNIPDKRNDRRILSVFARDKKLID